MEIKRRVERHPIIYLLLSSISVATAVAGITEYFCRQRLEIANQKSELRISTLEGDLTFIRRGMGESKYLDIRSFVYPEDRIGLLRTNPKSKYIAADGFYAILDLPGWQYESTSMRAFMAENGEKLSPLMDRFEGGVHVYVWKATEGITVKGSRNFADWGPIIFMQRIPMRIPPGLTKEEFAAVMKEIYGFDLKPDEIPDLPSGNLHVPHDDLLVLQLPNFIAHVRDCTGPDVDSKLIELEKVSNVIYEQILCTIHDGTANGKKVPTYFVRDEEILIAGDDAATMITITVPSADPAPRGLVYSQIQEWFSGLAIFASEGAELHN